MEDRRVPSAEDGTEPRAGGQRSRGGGGTHGSPVETGTGEGQGGARVGGSRAELGKSREWEWDNVAGVQGRQKEELEVRSRG